MPRQKKSIKVKTLTKNSTIQQLVDAISRLAPKNGHWSAHRLSALQMNHRNEAELGKQGRVKMPEKWEAAAGGAHFCYGDDPVEVLLAAIHAAEERIDRD